MSSGIRVVIVTAAAIAAIVVAGASSAIGMRTAETKPFLIGYAGAVQSNPNNKAVEDGIRIQARKLGMHVLVTDANLDPSKQISDVDTLVSRGVNALLIWPIDPKGIQPALSRARARGIPIIVQDTTVGGPYATNFQTNDFDAARSAALFVAKRIHRGASVAIIQGLPQVPVLQARNQGFLVGATKAGLHVVAQQVNQTDNADGARPIADAWKTKFGSSLKAILAYNDPSALGAASAVSGDFRPIIVGMNGSQEGINGVRHGFLAATWDQRTVEIGNGMAWAAYQVLAKHAHIPKTINVLMKRFDSTNVNQWIPVSRRLKAPMKVSIQVRDGKAYLEAQL